MKKSFFLGHTKPLAVYSDSGDARLVTKILRQGRICLQIQACGYENSEILDGEGFLLLQEGSVL